MFKTITLMIFAATRPDTFRVERTARINAPAEKIFPLIDDFHRWGTWSPYEKLDPDMQRSFGGSASGKGATYAWESKGKAGAGRMEITESTPSSKIAISPGPWKATTWLNSRCSHKATLHRSPGPCTARALLSPSSWASSSTWTR